MPWLLLPAAVMLVFGAYCIINDIRPTREGVGIVVFVLGLGCAVAAPVLLGLALFG